MNESSGRKVGIARFFELLGRDLWSFYRASFLCCAAFLPGFAAVLFGLMAHAPLLCALGGALGGALAGPFLVGLADTVLRALRDEPGYWWHTYKRAWRQNWRQSLIPGALLGLFLGGWSAVLFHMVNDANPGTLMWVAAVVGMFVCVGFFVWLFAQIPLVDLPLPELIKNAALMFFGFLPRTGGSGRTGAGTPSHGWPLTTGILRRFSFSMPARYSFSSGAQKLTAVPSAPARAVRPMRCT